HPFQDFNKNITMKEYSEEMDCLISLLNEENKKLEEQKTEDLDNDINNDELKDDYNQEKEDEEDDEEESGDIEDKVDKLFYSSLRNDKKQDNGIPSWNGLNLKNWTNSILNNQWKQGAFDSPLSLRGIQDGAKFAATHAKGEDRPRITQRMGDRQKSDVDDRENGGSGSRDDHIYNSSQLGFKRQKIPRIESSDDDTENTVQEKL
ncbi:MAG: hypothetical protein EZS28_044598, partial [Streblomastix strix]